MLTQEMLTVLEIALIANAIVIASLIAAPRVRDWLYRRSVRPGEADGGAAVARAFGPGSDASQPWFVASPTNGSNGTPSAASNGALGGTSRATAGGASSNATSGGPAHLHRMPVERPAEALPAMGSASTWATWLDEEAARTARYDRPVTIVLVELAGLERLADRVGSAAADRLIPPVASTIRRQARAADRLARLSTTRFGVLLVETDEVSAINYIERVRSACDVWLAAGAVSLRLSVGWAEIRPDRSVEAAAREAEQRLFDDRRRSEPVDPAAATDDHDSRSAVLQPSGT
jgi:diguanylate cyclase (GGDEF)-like protein